MVPEALPSSAEQTDPPASPLSAQYRAATIGVIALVTLIGFEALGIATAMPVIASDLDFVREYGFAFAVFLTASLIGVVGAGRWCDARGPLGVVGCGLALFALGLALSGLARSAAVLLAGRAVAGFGSGLLVVAMYVTTAVLYPATVQPRVFSWISAAWVVPSFVGPWIAGWLAQTVSWRAVFLLIPPFVVMPAVTLMPRLRAAAVARSTVPGEPHRSDPGDDRHRLRQGVLAGVGLAIGVGMLHWSLDQLGRPEPVAAGGLASGWQRLLPVLGASLLMIVVTLRPLLPAGTLWLRRGLATVVALRGMYAAAFFGAEAFIPLMLVTQRHLTPAEAGLVFASAAVGWTAGAFLQPRHRMRLPAHVQLAGGGLLLGTGLAALVLVVALAMPTWVVAPVWMFAGLGMGVGITTTSVLTLRLSVPGEEGRNSAGLHLSDSLGGALGVGLTGAAFAAWHAGDGATGQPFSYIWLGCAVLGLLIAMVAARARTSNTGH